MAYYNQNEAYSVQDTPEVQELLAQRREIEEEFEARLAENSRELERVVLRLGGYNPDEHFKTDKARRSRVKQAWNKKLYRPGKYTDSHYRRESPYLLKGGHPLPPGYQLPAGIPF